MIRNLILLALLATGSPLTLTSPLPQTDFLALHGFSATIPGQQTPLFSDITFAFTPGRKYSLVGPNGCGKSTLIKQIVAAYSDKNGLPYDPPLPLVTDGKVLPPFAKKFRMGYISQSSVSLSDKTLMEECVNSVHNYEKIKKELEAVQERVEGGDFEEETLDLLGKMEAEFEAIGGYNVESRIVNVLKGLSFKDEDTNELCSSFSGGWQMRISLCKLLISNPDFMILDEPSNHLDASARTWLSNYLKEYEGSILLVSHDVGLINKVCDNILEFNDVSVGGLEVFKNVKSYDDYLVEKERRYTAKLAEWERNTAEAARLQEFVNKFGASATKAKAAQSKLKQIERMEKAGMLVHPGQLALRGVTDSADVSEKNKQAQLSKTKVSFPTPPPAGEILLSLKGADIGYKDWGVMLPKVDLEIEAGMRIIVRGANGAGKSTLLKALCGSGGDASEVEVYSGERWVSPGTKMNVFNQDAAQDLNPEVTAVESVAEIVREYDIGISDTTIRSVLGQLTLNSNAQAQKIKTLSGGEKARVALASFILKPANLLVLDEPSNHVDINTIDALANGIASFEEGVRNKQAAVVIISHDRSFVEKLKMTHVCSVEGGQVKLEERNLRESDWTVEGDGRAEVSKEEEEEEEVVVQLFDLPPEERKKLHNAPKRIKRIEETVAKKEAKLAEIDNKMIAVGQELDKLQDLNTDRQKIEVEIEKLMSEWEELDLLIEQNSS
ncbi:hypothetical protein TrST_g8280 [Triparma strigata]|uniref:ABC transporter domain-containing protein n=1 Tax=Triparma strigata TaxID=1606541 RepID=A0A9W6ZMD9_9STRA|nr:hypothetical protein TrST_g8280 [Triparma strigata]